MIKKGFAIVFLVILSVLIGFIDLLSGSDFSFAPCYLISPSLAAWYLSKEWAFFISLLNSTLWLWVDFSSGRYSPIFPVYAWNFTSRLIFLVVVVILISSIRTSLDHEKLLSRTDSLTAALNSRSFRETLTQEIDRSIRYQHPLTLVYLDIDNFKLVNDRLGHKAGDEVLSAVAKEIQRSIRQTDILGRLGGDEFAILLIEAGPDAALNTVTKIRANLTRVIKRNDWPISLSFGVLTSIHDFCQAEKMVKLADELMYSVKKSTKNDAAFAIYNEKNMED